ncbi:hypothetical protein ACHQM5_029577 [Ranunculus cassubicifolius]
MTKIHPRVEVSSSPSPSPSPSSSSSCYVTSEREVFTIWMKSLVLNGYGCTVFDRNGDIIYRMDNYDSISRKEVHLMDLKGLILFTILKKKFRIFGRWEGYRLGVSMLKNRNPWFQVRKLCNPKGKSHCEVTIKMEENELACYRIEKMATKSACKIVDQSGALVAEVAQKRTTSGVKLGSDVLTLMVEPHIDHLLVMGLVIVYGLINHRM